MAKYTILDASVTINGKDLSDHVSSVTITYEAEEIDVTAMGTDGSREKIAGLKNWSAEINCQQNHAAGEVDATLFPLVGDDAFPVIFKPTSGAVSPSNPSFTGDAILLSYNPIAGAVGEFSSVSVPLAGTGLLSRNTT